MVPLKWSVFDTEGDPLSVMAGKRGKAPHLFPFVPLPSLLPTTLFLSPFAVLGAELSRSPSFFSIKL